MTFVLGMLTTKGPAVPCTVIATSSLLLFPPPATLSLTVNLKVKLLATLGTASHCHEVAPVLIVESLGKYLFESVEGLYDLKAGPDVAFTLGLVVDEVPVLNCSQQ